MQTKIQCPLCRESFTEKGLKVHQGSNKCLENAKKLVKPQALTITEEAEEIQCPYCSNDFAESAIEAHMEKCLEEGQEEVKEIVDDSESELIESEISASECESVHEDEEQAVAQEEIVIPEEEEKENASSPIVVFDVDAVDYLAVA